MKMEQKKQYNLEERTLRFAAPIRQFVRSLPKTLINFEDAKDAKQLIRSSGSVGANYIEANESISKRECLFSVLKW